MTASKLLHVAELVKDNLACETIALLLGITSAYVYSLRAEALKNGLIKIGEGDPPFELGGRKMRVTDLGYTLLAPAGPDGKRRAVARFTCVECHTVLDFPRNGGALNPEMLAKRARNSGWQASAYRGRSYTYCPTCAGPKQKNDPESELKRINPMPIAPPPAPIPAAMQATPELKLTVPVTQPDKEQRLRIRSELDHYFDDDIGAYLEGYSDQRVAEIVGVPRVVVEQIRETAYGPIRADPEVVAIRVELSTLRNRMEDMQKALDKLKADGAAIGSHIEQYIAKRAS